MNAVGLSTGGRTRSIVNGGEKYLKVTHWLDLAACFAALRQQGIKDILAAMPPKDEIQSRRLGDIPFAEPTALVFVSARSGFAAASAGTAPRCPSTAARFRC